MPRGMAGPEFGAVALAPPPAPERQRRRLGMPRDWAGHDFGAIARRPPPLHNPRVEIDNPVLPHAFALIEPALCLPIGAGGRWRQNSARKQERVNIAPMPREQSVRTD